MPEREQQQHYRILTSEDRKFLNSQPTIEEARDYWDRLRSTN